MKRLALLLALALGGWTHGSAPITVPSQNFGTLYYYDTTPYPSGTTAMRSWGTRTWSDIATADGVYDWTEFDIWLRAVTQNGATELSYTFGYTPVWAQANQSLDCNGAYLGYCSPPSQNRYYTDFVKAVIARMAPYCVNGVRCSLEMWNEASSTQFWGGTKAQLIAMLEDGGVAAARTAGFTVLSPSSFGFTGPQWLHDYLVAGGGPLADKIAVHLYPRFPCGDDPVTAECVIELLDELRWQIAQAGYAHLEVWDTESGWGQNSQLSDAALRPAFLVKSYLLRWTYGVRRFFWYAYDDQNWGTLYNTSTGQINSAGTAFGVVRSWLSNSIMQPCIPAGTVWTCDLRKGSVYRAQAVWNSAGSSSFTTPAWATRYQDTAGTVTTGLGGTTTITASPILFENQASP